MPTFKNINYEAAVNVIFLLIRHSEDLMEQLLAVGHRVVHGGESFMQSVVIDEAVLNEVKNCSHLAPLHNPANLIGIECAQSFFSELPQIAVFDTAFHQTMPKYACLYAIPFEFYEKYRVRRYGFHGTSHRYVTCEAAKVLEKPLEECAFISAHLGNGCSISAVLNGKSVDTSMGLTPLEGLVMGTRSGDIDPSLHAYLAEKLNYDVNQVTDIFNKKSGLLGISNLSADMRIITEAAEEDNQQAILAIEIFCYRLAKYIASYIVPLGRIDALIFTGGIGENAVNVRAKVLNWLKYLNFDLDEAQNNNHGASSCGIITQTGKSPVAMVVKTYEELLIAQDALSLVK